MTQILLLSGRKCKMHMINKSKLSYVNRWRLSIEKKKTVRAQRKCNFFFFLTHGNINEEHLCQTYQ